MENFHKMVGLSNRTKTIKATRNWTWSTLVSCAMCWLCILTTGVNGQTCTRVADSYVACEQNNLVSVSLSCPEKYIIKITSMTYSVSSTSSCPASFSGPPPPGDCIVSTNPSGLTEQCDKKRNCQANVAKDTSGTCNESGPHYISILFYCEPLHYHNADKAAVTSMEAPTTAAGVQLVYISSNTKVLMENGATFSDTSLGCIVTLPERAEAAIQLLIMLKSPPQASACNQKIQFWDGAGYERTVCMASTSAVTLAGCDVSENTFYIRYLNSDPSVKVGFVISIGVSHHTVGFSMRCGLNVADLPEVHAPTTPSLTTTEPTVATGNPNLKVVVTEKPQDDESLRLVYILVGVAGVLITLVIIVGVLVRRYSRKATILDDEPEDLTGKRGFSYVRNVYLDGDKTSSLVMDKRRSTTSDGSMALRM